jgi:hypothetical protein
MCLDRGLWFKVDRDIGGAAHDASGENKCDDDYISQPFDRRPALTRSDHPKVNTLVGFHRPRLEVFKRKTCA